MNVGDGHWVDFPPRNGHVPRGRRPAIIAQDASVTAHLPTVLVIPLTTPWATLRFPETVLVDPDQDHGLRQSAVALVVQLAVLDQRLIGLRMGQVSQSVMDAVWDALDMLTGRP
jgi:mRNA-degrading endonuclease toxin of MazEF toxin-antitoxin module